MKTENISKQSFKIRLISLIIISPIVFGFSTLILYVLIAPFIENRFTDHDSAYLSGVIIFFIIILPMWMSYLFKYKIGPITQNQKIDYVAWQISNPFDLSYDDVKKINSVEGWEYYGGEDIRLNDKELKEAFLLANKIASKDQGGGIWGIVPGIIISFALSLLFLADIKNWRNPDHWPIIGIGLILFCFCLYLFIPYIKTKKYFLNKNQDFLKLDRKEDK